MTSNLISSPIPGNGGAVVSEQRLRLQVGCWHSSAIGRGLFFAAIRGILDDRCSDAFEGSYGFIMRSKVCFHIPALRIRDV